jgi:transposase
MSKLLVSDELWAVMAPLLPAEPAKPKGGRPRLDDRKVLTGIIFVLKNGIGWDLLPSEMGCGSGMTCWRRLRDWNRAGVWERLHREHLQRLADADKIDWSRASLDSASIPAKRGPGDGSQSHRPRQAGEQTPTRRRPRWYPTRHNPLGGQCP